MCRWITVLSSESVCLADVVLTPSNSLTKMSKDASFHPFYTDENNHVTNGDGFGVGWYHDNCPVKERRQFSSPGSEQESVNSSGNNSKASYYAAVFKDTQPAWNSINLREICKAVSSHCIVAHVRAASPFAGISEENTHPFKAGRLLFCHNGRIPKFDRIRRELMNLVSDEAYVKVRGKTDSECIFALILTFLSEDTQKQQQQNGDSVPAVSAFEQMEPFGHKRLTMAVKRALQAVERTLANCDTYTSFSTCNFCLTDGETTVVTRFCDKQADSPPPSLYFAFGDARTLEDELINEEGVMAAMQQEEEEKKSGSDDEQDEEVDTDDNDNYALDLHFKASCPGKIYADVDLESASFIVASCPLTRTHAWHPMPKNSIMWHTRGHLPELRLLKRKKDCRTIYMTPPTLPSPIVEKEVVHVMDALVPAL